MNAMKKNVIKINCNILYEKTYREKCLAFDNFFWFVQAAEELKIKKSTFPHINTFYSLKT